MESSFTHYKEQNVFQNPNRLADFLNNTATYYNSTDIDSHYGKNFMSLDLGFDNNGQESAKHFKLACQTAEILFDLVLISEYFDESLVLLKNARCWTFDDVQSIPLNIRSNTTKQSLPDKTQEKIKNLNQLD
ncbi:galactose-3-O-sulfotransferase 2-like [Pelobates cultripes]|uniref:Galactose-3-O-sulfotransferase 2-like n=1 Tax=Pelobates cultripes TaxID=61616 RepID=A0AAD1VSW5_PELCU|nr:galactose-3-O-sulfotransferase 2-like [Pelobates cultripes]